MQSAARPDGRSVRRSVAVLLALALLPLLPLACRSLGPGNVAPDSFDYNQAVARAAHEQMLLNLVRLRYGEPPTFLDVSSVLAQYTYLGTAGLDGATGEAGGTHVDSFGGSLRLTYSERPTITYSPLRGEAFANQLLTPIPTELVFALMQSGWPVDELLVMSVQRFNDLRTSALPGVTDARAEAQGEAFARATALIIQLSLRDAIEVVHDPSGSRVMVLADLPAADTEGLALQDEFRTLLGLDPAYRSFTITRRVTDRRPDELLVRVRTLLDLMGFLSRGVDVPAAHVSEGRAAAQQAGGHAQIPLHVACQPERPVDAQIAVEYQGQWFSIAHSDHRSKRSFGLLTYLFQLMSPDTSGAAPLLTVAAGG